MPQGWTIGRLFGIRISADWSLLVMLLLLTTTLGAALSMWHTDWSSSQVWLVSLCGAVLFVGSILAHEMSHALVARRSGIPVASITLFVFGGIANIEHEPPSPKAELKMAIVGPITSLVIGAICIWIVNAAAPAGNIERTEELLHQLGPVTTLLAWLGPLNIALGLFNLIPGFPLDGGRILRALLWAGTKNLNRSTHIAATCGQTVGGLLAFSGVAMAFGMSLPFFGTGAGSGLWLIVLGWFLFRAATVTKRNLIVGQALGRVPVSLLMRSARVEVEANMAVKSLVDEVFPKTDSQTIGVVKDHHLEGLVSRRDVKRIPSGSWPTTTVSQIMTPIELLPTLDPTKDSKLALEELERQGIAEVPIVSEGHLVGTVGYGEIAGYLANESQQQRANH